MSDPLSFIALGAGIGGLASKFAEKAWETSEHWLTSRFSGHSAVARAKAKENAAAFMVELATRIQKLEDAGQIRSEAASKEEEHPQFTVTLQAAIIRAAQTDNREKHLLLADLIARRLASESESILSLSSQMAVDAIALATNRQLRLLALCSFIEVVRPKGPLKNPGFWLDVFVKHFNDVAFYEIDAMHLVALSCATFDPTFNSFEEGAFSASVYLEDLQSLWDSGLSGVKLTSVGSLIGALAFDHILGVDLGMPKWYGA
jgi:hypothetical protein